MTRLRALCTAVVLVCASGQVLADTASHNASAEAFLKLAHADKLGTPGLHASAADVRPAL